MGGHISAAPTRFKRDDRGRDRTIEGHESDERDEGRESREPRAESFYVQACRGGRTNFRRVRAANLVSRAAARGSLTPPTAAALITHTFAC